MKEPIPETNFYYVVALLEGLGFCNVKDVHDGSRNWNSSGGKSSEKGGQEKSGFEPLNNHKSNDGTSSGTSDDAEKKKSCKSFDLQDFLAEREALELILSQNIIKLQTTDNQV